VDPKTAPWSAVDLEDDQTIFTCLPAPTVDVDASATSSAGAAVCKPTWTEDPGTIDASAAHIDDGGTD
jgi:hypothetical protein